MINFASIINDKRKINALIIAVALILFVPFLGSVHLFDWDEINFAEAAREMIDLGDYSTVRIDFHPFHEKPPLFIWFQVVSMKIFGVNEFAARFPNAIIAVVSLLFIFNIGSKLYNNRFGLLWVLTYIGSFLPHFYFKTGLIDPTFNLFMYAAIFYLYQHYKNGDSKNSKHCIYAGIAVSLAVLTKGPVGYLLPTLAWAIFHLYKFRLKELPIKNLLIYTIISFLPLVIWYVYIAFSSDSFVLSEFIHYHIRLLSTGDAGHSGPIYYHLVMLLLGCFPASFIALNSFLIKDNSKVNSDNQDFRIWNIILFFVVLVIFSLVQTKIIHYSSLAYFPITFLAANSLYNFFNGERTIGKYQNILLVVFGLVCSLMMSGFPYFLSRKDEFLHLIRDKVAFAVLRDNVFNINLFDYLPGAVLLIGILVFLLLIMRNQKNAYLSLFVGVAASIILILPVLAPKLEYALQGRPIEFYQELRKQDAYVITVGFKSYAPYFYNQRKFINSSAYRNCDGGEFEDYLLKANLDKNVYIVSKISYDTANFNGLNVQLINSVGGYNFFQKMK